MITSHICFEFVIIVTIPYSVIFRLYVIYLLSVWNKYFKIQFKSTPKNLYYLKFQYCQSIDNYLRRNFLHVQKYLSHIIAITKSQSKSDTFALRSKSQWRCFQSFKGEFSFLLLCCHSYISHVGGVLDFF